MLLKGTVNSAIILWFIAAFTAYFVKGLCGLFGVGALLAAYVSRVTENDESFKANISTVFIADNTFRIILYNALGLFALSTGNQFYSSFLLPCLGCLWA